MRVVYARVTLKKPIVNRVGTTTGYEKAERESIVTGITPEEVQSRPVNIARVLNVRRWDITEDVKGWKVDAVVVLNDFGEQVFTL